jgi:hypothetical protein
MACPRHANALITHCSHSSFVLCLAAATTAYVALLKHQQFRCHHSLFLVAPLPSCFVRPAAGGARVVVLPRVKTELCCTSWQVPSLHDIEAAALAANAHGFICDLPLAYDTPVTDKYVELRSSASVLRFPSSVFLPLLQRAAPDLLLHAPHAGQHTAAGLTSPAKRRPVACCPSTCLEGGEMACCFWIGRRSCLCVP